jgi:type VI protein secretion system component VasF
MKRKEIEIKQILRLPEGSLKEMDQALDRVLNRLRSNAGVNQDRPHEQPIAYSSASKKSPFRWIAAAMAAALVIAVAWLGINWQKWRHLDTSRWIARRDPRDVRSLAGARR